ncbi:MAG: hypothetical protein H7Z43_06445, partial [Clostridia bacterium]|nr:hypothetical protein [Deltaproteobacteria bacterium]
MKRLIFITFLTASTAQAQSRIDHAYISETVNGGAPVQSTNQRAHVSMTELGLGTLPLKLTNGVMLLGSLYGRHLIFNGADPTGRRNVQTLDELTVGAVVLVPLSERWRLAVIPAVGMQSAFQTSFSGKDMVYAVVASASYRI